MRPTLISYSQSIETVNEYGLKTWHKAGIEIELDNASELGNATTLAKEYVAETLKQQSSNPIQEVQIQQQSENKEAGLIASIYATKSINELETFRPYMVADPLAISAFHMMHKKLSISII